MTEDPLRPYRTIRNLDKSPEPRGSSEGSRDDEPPIFVIQKHDASTTHYDFRLEAGGVLKSWAVPKGPSTDPSERRLALRTEDHPLEYADFEGVIPEDEYGGGTVMVWDIGPYRSNKEADDDEVEPPSVAQQIEDGHVTVWLAGKKIRGGYALTRTSDPGDDQERWIFVKMKDDEADARRNPTNTENKSAISERTMSEISDEEEPISPEDAPEPAES